MPRRPRAIAAQPAPSYRAPKLRRRILVLVLVLDTSMQGTRYELGEPSTTTRALRAPR